MRAGMIEFSNIVSGYGFVTVNGPEFLNAVTPHIENAGAEWSSEPLMQRGPVIVTVQVGKSIVEVGKGVRSVDHYRYAVRMSHIANGAHRQNVPGDVHHMRYHQQPGFLRQRV